MIRNFIVIAIRNLLRNPVYALINIFGLSIGITCSLLILLFIKNEISYDRFNKNRNELYRLVFENVNANANGSTTISPQMTAPVAPDMMEEFPEVKAVTRITGYRDGYLTFQNKSYKAANVIYADSLFFEMFSYEIISGNPQTILKDPFTVVLNEETAKNIFGNEDPIGKIVKWNNKDNLMVQGIVRTPPINSHLQFSSLISFSSLYEDKRLYMDWNGGVQYYHYIELLPGASKGNIGAMLPEFMYRHINKILEGSGFSINAILQPVLDIHLKSNYVGEIGANGSMSAIIIYSAIALFILMIACINFMNLTTARSTRRAREIGLRKVLGAEKESLIGQFLGESVIMSLIGFIIALIMIEILMPVFNNMVGRDLDLYQARNLDLIISMPLFIIIIGLIAGSYPAFIMSSFVPANVLKGKIIGHKGSSGFRNFLVLFQFAISLVLIICTLVIYAQLGFVKSMDVGYQRENILVLRFTSEDFKNRYLILKDELKSIPGIISSSATSELPGTGFTSNGYLPEGFDKWIMFNAVDVDYDYIETMGLQVISGRSFSPNIASDKNAFMINETLAKELNWSDPEGKTIEREGVHQIIGMVKDFHFASLHQEIGPLIFTMRPYMGFDFLLVRFKTDNLNVLINNVRKAWENIDPNEPFEYYFLDDVFNEMYKAEQKLGTMLLYIAILAIIIACMGLFGLALYSTEQSTKEIGLRKVFGSTVSGVVLLLTGKFTRWVLLANLLAWPVAFILIRKYMQMYAYRIDLPVWVFFLTALGTYLVALITISVQSVKAGTENPAKTLRYE
jgi:putative ABC transport system permease protein